MVRIHSVLLLSFTAMLWGWNAGAVVWQVVPPSVEAPSPVIRCGPDCRVAWGDAGWIAQELESGFG